MYDVVAIADMDDGKQYASVRAPFSVAGKKLKLIAKVNATKGANKKIAWKSANTEYATVNAKGIVKTKSAGKGKKVMISAMATDGSKKKNSFTIKIK